MLCLRCFFVSMWVLACPGGTSALNENVNVLVLLPRNDSYMFSIARVSPAIEFARRQLPGFSFSVHYVNSECGVDALYALVDRARDERPDLILGPVCEYAAASVIRVASHWRIPVISAGALASGFSNKNSEYALLTRTAPSYLKMAETFATMSRRFGWRSVHLIYQEDKEERNCYFTVEGVHTLLEGQHDISVSVIDSKEPLAYVDEVVKSMYEHEGTQCTCNSMFTLFKRL